jgi:ParB family chromosome partitioning protein
MDQERIAAEVVERQLSVRQTENLVRNLQNQQGAAGATKSKARPRAKDSDTLSLERDLSDRLGAEVQIAHDGSGKGKLTVSFGSLEQLDGVLRHLK